MMRGFSAGSAERSQTWPRAFGETRVGAITAQWPSYSSAPWSSKYAAPMWSWMSGAGRPGRVRVKAQTSATVELSLPLRRSSHSARGFGLSAP